MFARNVSVHLNTNQVADFTPSNDEKIIPFLLIKDGALLPDGYQVDSKPYSKGWRVITNLRAAGTEPQLNEARWTFWNWFYQSGYVEVTAIGSDLEKTTRRAVKKVVKQMEAIKMDCLEIGQITVKRFLGMPCVAVSAHPRHISEGALLFRIADWEYGKLATAPAPA
jgi:hypothetical protein